MEKIINWGIIGLGNAALNLAKEFDKIGNSKLLAVASLTQKKREFFKRRFNLLNLNIYSTYNEIFNNKDIDIIFISLPNSMHEEFCIKAIQNNTEAEVTLDDGLKAVAIGQAAELSIKEKRVVKLSELL